MTKLGIEVRLNDEIKDIAAFGSDPVIIATGSTPRLLRRVPGYEKMIEGCDYLNGAEVGNTVAVIGGGLTGCEIAYELALQGKNPIIVEMKDDLISQTGVCLANSSYLREWFALHKTPVYLETTLKEVKDGSIVCTGKDGRTSTSTVTPSSAARAISRSACREVRQRPPRRRLPCNRQPPLRRVARI